MGDDTPRPRAALDGIGRYRPGKAAEAAMQEYDLTTAIKLASNELPFGPLPAAERAVIDAMHRGNRYSDHLAVELREALAARHGLDVGQVAVGCGSVGLLQQLFLSYLDPGDEVVYGWRTFETYPIYASVVGARSVTVPLRHQALDASGLVDATSEQTRMVLITSPNNPTGTALGRAELQYVLENVPHHTVVVLDEAYREFMTRADRPDPVALLADHPNLVVLRTFSKAYGLAALRIGYAFAAPDVIDALVKTLVPFTVNGLGQAAAIASLGADGELRERLAAVLGERARVERELRDAGFSVPDPQANFVWLPAGAAAAALTVGLERRGVVTRPFGGEGVRVTVGTAEENDRFLTVFASVAAEADAASAWGLPSGDAAKRVGVLLGRLDAAVDRLGSAGDPDRALAGLGEVSAGCTTGLTQELDLPRGTAVSFEPTRAAEPRAHARDVAAAVRSLVAGLAEAELSASVVRIVEELVGAYEECAGGGAPALT